MDIQGFLTNACTIAQEAERLQNENNALKETLELVQEEKQQLQKAQQASKRQKERSSKTIRNLRAKLKKHEKLNPEVEESLAVWIVEASDSELDNEQPSTSNGPTIQSGESNDDDDFIEKNGSTIVSALAGAFRLYQHKQQQRMANAPETATAPGSSNPQSGLAIPSLEVPGKRLAGKPTSQCNQAAGPSSGRGNNMRKSSGTGASGRKRKQSSWISEAASGSQVATTVLEYEGSGQGQHWGQAEYGGNNKPTVIFAAAHVNAGQIILDGEGPVGPLQLPYMTCKRCQMMFFQADLLMIHESSCNQ